MIDQHHLAGTVDQVKVAFPMDSYGKIVYHLIQVGTKEDRRDSREETVPAVWNDQPAQARRRIRLSA